MGDIEFHGYHTAMEEVTLLNDGNTFQVMMMMMIRVMMMMMMMMMIMMGARMFQVRVRPWRDGETPFISGGGLKVLLMK